MQNDYILIAVDLDKKFAIRFLSLAHTVERLLNLQKPSEALKKLYSEFLLSSTILGSRLDEQESILFKLQMQNPELTINCEVSPRGAMRSAIFPPENKNATSVDLQGLLKVVRLNKGNEVYQSVVEWESESVESLIRKYLEQSVQTQSLFFVNGSPQKADDNYALWIEKLPGTSDDDWMKFAQKFNSTVFQKSFKGTNDPDVIIQRLFEHPISILAVTKPQLTCTCSKEKIMRALQLLSPEDLADIFMQGEGVSTTCDYCQREWQISDDDVKELMNVKTTLH